MTDHTLYETTVPTDGSVALAHQQIIRVKINGVFLNITGDVNNLVDTPTDITVPRESYGLKGLPDVEVIGRTHAITFTVEGVRNPVTKAIAQAWLVHMLNLAKLTGNETKIEAQVFDALDPALPAYQGWFRVGALPGSRNFTDKAIWNFTLSSIGIVEDITSPIAGTGAPIIESVTPPLQAVGEQVVIRGYNLQELTALTIDGQTVALDKFQVADGVLGNIVVAIIPAAVTGSAPVVATNEFGASTAAPYTAA